MTVTGNLGEICRGLRRGAICGVALLGVAGMARAQSVDARLELPDAPVAKQSPDGTQKPEGGKFGSTFGILGKRSIFFPELAFDKGPLTSHQKLELAVDETISPSRFTGSAFTAAINQARGAFPGYGGGWGGYGKRFGSSVASNASNHLFGTFLLPSMLHQDPRYFVKVYDTPTRRVWYAVRRVLVTRTDSGGEAFNWSGSVSGLMVEGLANSYLPDGERSARQTFERYGYRLGTSALSNVVKEFWPTIFKSLKITKFVPAERSDPGTVTPPVGPPAPKPQR
ncbi:MAG TPA: hypothetical protein VGI16_11130 [Candidatus Acidoferrum sp.]